MPSLTIPDDATSNTSSLPSATTSFIPAYSYDTSKIVRTAVALGIIVLVLTALVLFFKVGSTPYSRIHNADSSFS